MYFTLETLYFLKNYPHLGCFVTLRKQSETSSLLKQKCGVSILWDPSGSRALDMGFGGCCYWLVRRHTGYALSCSVNSWNPFMEQPDLVKLIQIPFSWGQERACVCVCDHWCYGFYWSVCICAYCLLFSYICCDKHVFWKKKITYSGINFLVFIITPLLHYVVDV